MAEIFNFKTLLLDDRSLCEFYEFSTWRNRDSKIEISRYNFLIITRFTSHFYVNVSERLQIFCDSLNLNNQLVSFFLAQISRRNFWHFWSILKNNKTKNKLYMYLFKAFVSKGMMKIRPVVLMEFRQVDQLLLPLKKFIWYAKEE